VAKQPSNQYFSEFFEKGLKVLALFTQDRTTLSLKEVALEIGITKPSAYRYVNTLVELGYLRKDPRTKLLRVGPNAISLGQNLVQSHDVLQIIKKFTDYVRELHHFTIDSVLTEGNEFVRLYISDSGGMVSFHSVPIEVAWYSTSLAKAILAFYPEEERDAIIDSLKFEKQTEKTITSKEELLADLEATRQRGYAVHNEEFVANQVAIGAPIFDLRTNRPIGAISFDFPTSQISLEEVEQKYAQVLLKLTRDISEAIPQQ
jgi:DNA-binding IclR family transcriptional regulator